MSYIVVIDIKCTERIKAAVRYAFEHPLMPADLAKTNERGEQTTPPPAPLNVMIEPYTWVIFTVERNAKSWVRHLSIVRDPRTTTKPGTFPDETAVEMLLQLFEFEKTRIGQPGHSPFIIHIHNHGPFSSLNIFEPVQNFPSYAAT